MTPTPISEMPARTARQFLRWLPTHCHEDESGCWIWTGRINRYGYGKARVAINGVMRETGAHRASWLAHRGAIPDGLVVDHLCRNRVCVNPWHMELVTNAENIRRGHTGQWDRGEPGFCVNGHERSEHNIVIRVDRHGYVRRACRPCNAAHLRRWRERRATA